MSERETRAKLRRLCAALDRRAAPAHPLTVVGVVAPLVVGAGLAMTGCTGEEDTQGGGGDGATTSATGTVTGTSTGSGWGGAMPTYGIGGFLEGGYGGTGGQGGAMGGAGGAGGQGGDAGGAGGQ